MESEQQFYYCLLFWWYMTSLFQDWELVSFGTKRTISAYKDKQWGYKRLRANTGFTWPPSAEGTQCLVVRFCSLARYPLHLLTAAGEPIRWGNFGHHHFSHRIQFLEFIPGIRDGGMPTDSCPIPNQRLRLNLAYKKKWIPKRPPNGLAQRRTPA